MISILLILRHLESNKNIHGQFSSLDDTEELTQSGVSRGIEIAHHIAQFVYKHGLNVDIVYSANSTRAIKTARIVANELGVDVLALNELRSNNSGILRGKNEIEAQRLNPTFMKQLKLYRAGIYSSYDFDKVFERENKLDFEKRVCTCLEEIMDSNPNNLKIIVMHHSSLTSAIIYFARRFYNYPQNYYGHVACELGNLYLISDNEIVLCNESAVLLESVEHL